MYADQEKRVQDSEPDEEAGEGGVHPESPCKGLNGYNSLMKQSQYIVSLVSVSLWKNSTFIVMERLPYNLHVQKWPIIM